MLYFDTSFLAPLILEEATSRAIERFLASLPIGSLAISHWTRVEMSSLLGREVRMGRLEAQAARMADAQFEAATRDSFVVLLPNADDYARARTYLAVAATGLRAGDALHLAIAANHGADAIYTLDRTMLRAAHILGLPASHGI